MKKKPANDAHDVLWSGDAHAIEKLFASKPNLNIPDAQGRTPLIEAALEKRTEIAKVLIEHGADVKVADHDGATALHFAARNHLPELVQSLIDKGAVVDAKDKHGDTPLFKAVQSFRGEANGDAVWALLLAGADKTIKNSQMTTPEDLGKVTSNYDPGQFFR